MRRARAGPGSWSVFISSRLTISQTLPCYCSLSLLAWLWSCNCSVPLGCSCMRSYQNFVQSLTQPSLQNIFEAIKLSVSLAGFSLETVWCQVFNALFLVLETVNGVNCHRSLETTVTEVRNLINDHVNCSIFDFWLNESIVCIVKFGKNQFVGATPQ